FIVDNYAQRETIDTGFIVEVEYEGDLKRFSCEKGLKNKQQMTVIELRVKDKKVVEIQSSLVPTTGVETEIWGIRTQNFQKVQLVLNSPNHWDGEQTGNRHLFFILEGCINPGQHSRLLQCFIVDNYAQRETIDTGFIVEVEYEGDLKRFSCE
ncbi:hypothetical protein CQA65_29955, partial [Klebsiella pneumoniae]